MRHPENWYNALARKLSHPGYANLAEIRQEEAREARMLAASAKWRKRGDSYHLDLDGSYYLITKVVTGKKMTWQIQAWSDSLGPDRAVRTQPGIGTLAEAKHLALAMPCARCGLVNSLALMTRRMPARPSLADLVSERWRCLDTAACEAERARITGKAEPARIDIETLTKTGA